MPGHKCAIHVKTGAVAGAHVEPLEFLVPGAVEGLLLDGGGALVVI